MRIKNKTTGLEYEVTAADWDIIASRGDARKYTVLSTTGPLPEHDFDQEATDFKSLVRKANAAFTEERYEDAKSLFLEAQDIKTTKLIERKLKEIEEKFS